jgi:hypothetical protein
MDYYKKYLKYKNKYLKLKKPLEGGSYGYTQEEIDNMSPEELSILFSIQDDQQTQVQPNQGSRPQKPEWGQESRPLDARSVPLDARSGPVDDTRKRESECMLSYDSHNIKQLNKYFNDEYKSPSQDTRSMILHIKLTFPESQNWLIADVRGDGLCMFNAILVSLNYDGSISPNELFIECIQRYFIKYSDEEMTIYTSGTHKITEMMKDGKMMTSTILNSVLLNNQTTRSQIEELLNDDNLDNQLLTILSDILNINILALIYDPSVKSYTFINYTPKIPTGGEHIVILINWGGHFRVLIAEDEIKMLKYIEITGGLGQGTW